MSVKGSRNISRDLFQGSTHLSSQFTKSRLSTKPATKGGSRAVQRLKTPDLILTNSQVKEESPERPESNLSVHQIMYRNTEFTVDDAHIMLNVMLNKCNEIINNSKIFIDNGLLTKKIFDD